MPQYIGSVYVDVKFDQTKIGTDLQQSLGVGAAKAAQASGRSLSQIGTDATRVGRQVSFGLSMPLLGISKAASNAYLSFDDAMGKIAALTDTPANKIEEFGQSARDIGVEFGVGADDAANALYQILSSGIDASQAIEVLRVSAQGAASGLGETADVAKVVTAAVNAYRTSGLTAAQATDILTMAVQEGTGEASDLVTSLGRVMPIAAQLGVGFDQVAGSLAAMTLSGNSADEAATQLTQVLTTILAPTDDAKEGLREVGLSAEGLQQQLSSDGLLSVLQTVTERFDGNTAATERVFGNIRALRGVYALYGQNASQSVDVVAKTQDAAGASASAWARKQATASAEAERAQSAFNDAMIEMGKTLTPVITELTKAAAGMVSTFKLIPGFLQPVVAGAVAFGIALGPVIYSVGSLISLFAGFKNVTGAMGARLAGEQATAVAATTTAEATVAETVATEANTAATAANAEVKAATAAQSGAFIGQLQGATVAQREAAMANDFAGRSYGTVMDGAGGASRELTSLEQSAYGTVNATDAAARSTENVGANAARTGTKVSTLSTAFGMFAVGALAAVVTMGLLDKGMEGATEGVNDLRDALDKATLKDTTGAWEQWNSQITKGNAELGKLAEEEQAFQDSFANPLQVLNLGASFDARTRGASAEEIQRHNNELAQLQAQSVTLAKTFNITNQKAAEFIAKQKEVGVTFPDDAAAVAAYRKEIGGLSSDTTQATGSMGQMMAQAKEMGDKFGAWKQADQAYKASLDRVQQATRQVQAADRGVLAAQRQATAATESLTAARLRQAEATKKVTQAQKNLADAQQALRDAESTAGIEDSLDLQEAQLALTEARKRAAEPMTDPIERQRAQIDVQRAQIALQRTQAAQGDRLAKAQEGVTSAQDSLDSANQSAADSVKAVTDAEYAEADAKQRVNDAQWAASDARKALSDAEAASVDAASTLAFREQELGDALKTQNGQADAYLAFLEKLKIAYPEIAGYIQTLIDKYKEMETKAGVPKPAVPPSRDVDRYTGNRAVGGPVRMGGRYNVVERGLPELYTAKGRTYLIPSTAGSVTALHPQSRSTGPAIQTGDINVYGADEPLATAFMVRRELRKAAFLSQGT